MTNVYGFNISFRRNHRAKRMKLRYDAETDSAIITMPARSSERAAEKFVLKNIEWLETQRALSPAIKYLVPGEVIPFRGKEMLIAHDVTDRGQVLITNTKIIVGGPREGFSVRLENYLKKYCRKIIEPKAKEMAFSINQGFKRIQIRDTKSRWGSCSSTGTLSFSWRLILAPEVVLDYVVAHEIAHLEEMNHSPAFWSVVDQLVDNATASRKWIKNEGRELMLIAKMDY